MKKSTLSVGLVTSFIGALALTACNSTSSDVTKKDGVIAVQVGYNGDKDKIEITSDASYEELSKTQDGIKKYYDAVLEALIRYEYPLLSRTEGSTLTSIETLESQAAAKVKTAEQTAADNAETNKTSKDKEWKAILESYDCETKDDLHKHFLYELEKTEITKWHYEENADSLKREYIGVNAEWKPAESAVENVKPVYPYHILHVLVTLANGKDNYNRGTISEDEANSLWSVVRNLIDKSFDFQETALNKTEDTGSKDQYGDVEIMSTKTSFYNEFKLGIYAYDGLLSGDNLVSDNEHDVSNIIEALGLNGEVETSVSSVTPTKESVRYLIAKNMLQGVKTPVHDGTLTIPTVPYNVFQKIGSFAKEDKIGLFSPESGDVALPRNVLYNQFLNFHSPFVVTNEDIVWDEGSSSVKVGEHNFLTGKANIDGVETEIENGLKMPNKNDPSVEDVNFKEVELPVFEIDPTTHEVTSSSTVTKKVLTDQEGNVIIGVRSEAGIHFMVMRKSVFYGTNKALGQTTVETTLEEYYTTKIPSEEGYPTGKNTFVNMKDGEQDTYYSERAKKIENEIQSTSTFDAAYDYRLYEMLMGELGGNIHFADEDESGVSAIEEAIEDYIDKLRETKAEDDAESINNAWESYMQLLNYQNTVRNDYAKSLLPTTCAFHFTTGNEAEYKEGGDCYVNQK